MKAGIGALVPALALSGCAAYGNAMVQRTVDQDYPAAQIRTLEIHTGSGDVRFLPSTRVSNVRVHGVIKALTASSTQNVELRAQRAGDRLIVTIGEPHWSFFGHLQSRYEITYPAGASVEVHGSSGEVAIDGSQRPVSISTASGDVKIGGAASSVDANSSSGDMTIQLAPGWSGSSVHLSSTSGDLHVRIPQGLRATLYTHTLSGSVRDDAGLASAGSGATLSLQTTSGDITTSF